MKKILSIALAAVTLPACTNNNAPKQEAEVINEKLTDCDIKVSGIHFTKALNGADQQVTDSVSSLSVPNHMPIISPTPTTANSRRTIPPCC